MSIEDTFTAATEHLQLIQANMCGEDDLLYLYARYKQVTSGPCKSSKPSIVNIKARRKWSAWQSLGNVSKQIAMVEYVQKIRSLDPSWTFNPSVKKSSGMGITVSIMKCDGEVAPTEDKDKDIFDWCKEGSLDNVKRLLSEIQPVDTEGRTILHWACDRGHVDIVKFLLHKGHDVNCQDNDLLTPLHYAASCDHEDIAKLLLEYNADVNLRDAEDETPADSTSSQSLRELLRKEVESQ